MTRNIAAVILAAGSSTRLGRPKQLVEIGGHTLVQRAAIAAQKAGVDSTFVVVGAFAEEVRTSAKLVNDVIVVFNPNWESGIASSLATGLEAAQAMACEAALVMTTDQALVDSASLKSLIDAFDADHRIVASAYSGTTGVPAVFGSEHFDALMQLRGDEGAGRWLRERAEQVTQVSMASAAPDIDTPADLANLNAQ